MPDSDRDARQESLAKTQHRLMVWFYSEPWETWLTRRSSPLFIIWSNMVTWMYP